MAVALRVPDLRSGLLCGDQCGEKSRSRCGDCAQAVWSTRRRWPSRSYVSKGCLTSALGDCAGGTCRQRTFRPKIILFREIELTFQVIGPHAIVHYDL